MGSLLQDLRFAFRQLRKSPSFAVTAILTLALGIGANTTIFSLVNSFLIRPLPVPDAQQIVTVVPRENNGPLEQAVSWNEYKQIRAQTTQSFSDTFAFSMNIDGLGVKGQQPDRIMTGYVSGNFFAGLGLNPAAGRLFLRSEGEILNHDPVIVLGYDYWKRKFNSDPGVVGRPVTLNGQPFTVVGVAPKGFQGLQTPVLVAAYLPLSELSVAGATTDVINNWQVRMFIINARLRPGATLKQADAELSLAAQSIMRQHPDIEKKLGLEAYPEPALRINTGDPKTMFVISGLFLSLAMMVLVLACVNVANLVLVRATAREREMAIRTALGARRSRLIGQMITESVLLALIGGVAGISLGVWASSLIGRLDIHADLPLDLNFAFDWRIFLYSFAVAILGGLVVGIVPALRIGKSNVNMVLHEGSRGIAGGKHWLRDSLVALQISASLVLLVMAGLFVRSLAAFQSTDFGFQPDHVLNFAVDANEIGLTEGETRDLVANIGLRLHQIAGVEFVSHASSVPLGYFGSQDRMTIDGAPPAADPNDLDAGYNVVAPEYFKVMGISLLRGRELTITDNEQAKAVAVISESAAKRFWPNQDAIGKTFRMASDKDRKVEVVGIARDVEFVIFGGGKARPFFYIPYSQHAKGNSLMIFQVRTQLDPKALVPTVEKAVHELAPQLPIFQVQTMHEAMYTLNGLLLFQIGATMAAVMGGLGLTLAVIGLYGVVSYTVGRRTHEIGLRMALGAGRARVFRMIYRQSIGIVVIGLSFGLAVALVAVRAASGVVVVRVWDPLTFISVAAILAGAALASCYLPARRAMSVQPMTALRED